MHTLYKRSIALFIALATIIICCSGCGGNKKETAQKVEDFKVTTYIRADYALEENSLHTQDFEIITHAIIFECANFDSDGNVVCDEDKLEAVLKNLHNAKGKNDIHISINLLGPSGVTDSTVWKDQMEAQSDQHNKAFESGILEDNIVSLLEKYDLDGVHFDYEYPLSKRAWRHYNKFLVSLDEKLGSYTLGVAVSEWNIGFKKSTIEAIDTFELMTYDFVDDEGKHATFDGTISRLQNKNLQSIPQEKMNIGLPFYSRPTDMDAYWYGYNSCYEKIDENGWYHCPETDKDFWFNTTDVIEAKTDHAINNGYGGVMIWHYSCDLPATEEGSLLRAISNTINKNY